MKILFATPRFPYPLRRGHQVRAFHQIRLLSARHRVTLLSCASEPPSREALETLGGFCEEIVTVPISRWSAARHAAAAIFTRFPLQVAAFDARAIGAAAGAAARRHRPDLIHVQLARMAAAFEAKTQAPRVIDLVDSLSLNMERRFRRDRSALRWAAYFEWKKMARYEREIAREFEHVTVVSPVDRKSIGEFPNLSVNPNGVDLPDFPFGAERPSDPTIVFTGNLGYFPNLDAIDWFLRDILPIVRRRMPEAIVRIAGARPTRRLRALARRQRVELDEDVARIGRSFPGAAVAVAPMRAGSGQLLKILEAMASGVPVVATSMAASAFAFESGREIFVADGAEDFAAAVIRALQDRAGSSALAREARRVVAERYTWDRSVEELERIYRSLTDAP